jgi:uncharacterized protein (UPF0276 family)
MMQIHFFYEEEWCCFILPCQKYNESEIFRNLVQKCTCINLLQNQMIVINCVYYTFFDSENHLTRFCVYYTHKWYIYYKQLLNGP